MIKANLDNGGKLIIVDDLDPEDIAMVQALYSRSAESAEVHLDKVAKSGSGKFMASYYVGYNHKSIADCGSTTMFIEGVSLLVAKAIQDSPLYSGQETSTRYLDMSKRPIVDPVGSPASKAILDRWMQFYDENMDRVSGVVIKNHPQRAGEDDEKYSKAVTARTFDIMRGFLPAGITTQLSWHSNLRQAADHLQRLCRHPVKEVNEIAWGLRGMLNNHYGSSGFATEMGAVSGVKPESNEAYEWGQMVAAETTYSARTEMNPESKNVFIDGYFRTPKHLAEILKTRPRGCVLPHFMTDLGRTNVECFIDFGSFRDWQRHRNSVIRMPLLTTEFGFEQWYLSQLGEQVENYARTLIFDQKAAIDALDADTLTKQYYIALGYHVPVNMMMGLPALLYFLELRSSKTVHPTLRQKVQQMALWFHRDYPDIALHDDQDPDDWSLRRGSQTITEK